MTDQSPTITPEIVAPEEQSQPPAVVAEPPAELVAVVAEAGLEKPNADGLLMAFKPSFIAANSIIADAKSVVVTDATMVTEIRKARELRLKLAKVRVAADKIREKMKENSKREGNAIQGVFNVLKFLVEPVEERLAEAEDFAVRAEAARKDALRLARTGIVVALGINPLLYVLGDMSEETFQTLVEGTKLARAAAAEAARKVEAERIAREAAEQAERERIRLENERLKREADEQAAALKVERERVAAEKAAADAKAALERAAVEKELKRLADEKSAAEAKAKAEREAVEEAHRKEKLRVQALAEVERQKAESARKEALAKHAADMAAIEATAKAEREKAAEAHRKATEKARQEREAIEAKLQAASDLARKERDEATARKAAEVEAARKAAAAPARDKLLTYANAVRALEIPSFNLGTSEHAIAITIAASRDKFASWIEEKAGAL